jgi:hypothetical protein
MALLASLPRADYIPTGQVGLVSASRSNFSLKLLNSTLYGCLKDFELVEEQSGNTKVTP